MTTSEQFVDGIKRWQDDYTRSVRDIIEQAVRATPPVVHTSETVVIASLGPQNADELVEMIRAAETLGLHYDIRRYEDCWGFDLLVDVDVPAQTTREQDSEVASSPA